MGLEKDARIKHLRLCQPRRYRLNSPMKRICSYTFSSYTSSYRNDVWPSLPYTEGDREFDLLRSSVCRYCGARMEAIAIHDPTATLREACVCSVCGYWFIQRKVVSGQDNIDIGLTIGEARHYDIDELEIPISDLRRYLRTNPDDVAHVNPFAFEKLVADCVPVVRCHAGAWERVISSSRASGRTPLLDSGSGDLSWIPD